MKAITERTMIPITWAAIGLSTLLGPAVVGAMWVKGVDDRLARIEARLHIQANPEITSGLVNSASAGERR